MKSNSSMPRVSGKKARTWRHRNNKKPTVIDELPKKITQKQRLYIEVICIKKMWNYKELMKNIKTWNEADKFLCEYDDILRNK